MRKYFIDSFCPTLGRPKYGKLHWLCPEDTYYKPSDSRRKAYRSASWLLSFGNHLRGLRSGSAQESDLRPLRPRAVSLSSPIGGWADKDFAKTTPTDDTIRATMGHRWFDCVRRNMKVFHADQSTRQSIRGLCDETALQHIRRYGCQVPTDFHFTKSVWKTSLCYCFSVFSLGPLGPAEALGICTSAKMVR